MTCEPNGDAAPVPKASKGVIHAAAFLAEPAVVPPTSKVRPHECAKPLEDPGR